MCCIAAGGGSRTAIHSDRTLELKETFGWCLLAEGQYNLVVIGGKPDIPSNL
ncbi:hypothetical protein D3C71_1098270 [compost metagenome]